jgi:hypothetical protein
MVHRRKGYPARRNRDHWRYPSIIWELDADLAAHPLYLLMSVSVPFRFPFFLQPQGVTLKSARVAIVISLPSSLPSSVQPLRYRCTVL